jgi:hypothetical protein
MTPEFVTSKEWQCLSIESRNAINAHWVEYHKLIEEVAALKREREIESIKHIGMMLNATNCLLSFGESIEKEKKLSDSLYFLLIDNPEIKAMADKIIAEHHSKSPMEGEQ